MAKKKSGAKKPKELPFDKVKYLTDHQLVTNLHVSEMQKEEDALKAKVDATKESAKAAKVTWEAKKMAKEQYIRERDAEFRSKKIAGVQATLTGEIEHREDAAKAHQMIEKLAEQTKMPADPKHAKTDTKSAGDGYDQYGVHENAWKHYPIDRLKKFGLTESFIEKLREPELKRGSGVVSPITTMGKLMEFVSPDPNNPTFARQLTDLKGVGAEAATKFGDAQEKFLAEWNRGTVSVEFAKELASKDKSFASLYRDPAGSTPAAEAKPAAKKSLRGGGAKPEMKKKAKPKSAAKAVDERPAGVEGGQPEVPTDPTTEPQQVADDVPTAAI